MSATTTELIPLENVNAATVFADKKSLDALLDKIEAHTKSFVADVSTDKGRKEVASLAYKIARSKTTLDAAGKKLVEGWKKQAAAVDEERRRARERLDTLKDEVRKPLNDWEEEQESIAEEAKQAELRRQENVDNTLRHIEDVGNGFIGGEPQAFGILFRELDEKIVIDDSFGTQKEEALTALKKARAKLEHAQDIQRREAEVKAKEEEIRKAEEERRAKEEAERAEKERAEREERIRKEAAERAEREAEEAREAARLSEERAKREAEEAKERERLAAERAEKERQEAVRQAEERARQEAEAKEQARLAEERRQREEDERRAADREHRAKINNAAMDALKAEGVGEQTAKKVITLIASGAVPRVSISY